MRMTDEQLKEHFSKVNRLVKYYLDNQENEQGTIEEALQSLFGELGEQDLKRAIDTIDAKQNRKRNAMLNVWNT